MVMQGVEAMKHDIGQWFESAIKGMQSYLENNAQHSPQQGALTGRHIGMSS